jgi:MFS family permease
MRRRSFELLVAAIFLSAVGDWLALTALALHLEETVGSGFALSGLFIALWAPLVVLSGHAGFLADRLEARHVLVAASLAQALVVGALAFSERLVPILVLTVVLGTANAVSQPAEFTLVPRVVPEERIGVANGHVETARFVGAAAGPVLGGVLAGVGGTQLPLLVDSATFVVIAAAAAALHLTAREHGSAGQEPIGRARDGFVHLVRDDVLRLVMLVAFASLLFMTASAPAEVFFAKDVLGVGDAGFGALWTSWFVGMALGGLVLSRRVRGGALAGAALVAIVVQSLGLALPAIWLSFAFAVTLYVVGGTAHGTKNVLVRTLLHRRVPAHLHGRAFAAYNGLRNGAEMVALLLGGLVLVAIGARWTLFLAGALPALAGLAGLAAYRRRRPGEAPVPSTETA